MAEWQLFLSKRHYFRLHLFWGFVLGVLGSIFRYFKNHSGCLLNNYKNIEMFVNV